MASRSISLYSSLFSLCSLASSFTLGEVPTQTLGLGEPFTGLQPLPTAAPRLELVKKRLGLERKALTNVCSEWTIPGGFGQPECSNSETCLFTSADDGNLYEACARTSKSYDWVTECWDYPMTGSPPVSQIYCGEEEPYCGFFAFIFGPESTYLNFGCSTMSYGFTVNLLETAAVLASLDPTTTSTPVVVNPAATTTKPTPKPISTSPLSTPQLTPSQNKKKKTTPIGPIVGGVIGGVLFLALIALLTWYLLRRNRTPNPATSTPPPMYPEHAAPPPATATAAEKPAVESSTTEYYQPPASLQRLREEEERARQGEMIYIPPAGYERRGRGQAAAAAAPSPPPTYVSGGGDQERPVSPVEAGPGERVVVARGGGNSVGYAVGGGNNRRFVGGATGRE
ncbi:hypothetical protein ACMFMG_010144 [Clarireedia jacksonii]